MTSTPPKKIIVLYLAVLVLVMDIICGRVLTAVYYRMGKLSEETIAELKHNRIKDPVFHHGLRPNAEFTDQWGIIRYPVRTNSLGFKDDKVREVPLDTQRYRIVFMGDSFTEGTGVVFEETFAGRVKQALEAKNIDVLNAAVQTYSPAIYYAKTYHLLETVGLTFEEMVLFLDNSDINDEALEYVLDPDTKTVGEGMAPVLKREWEARQARTDWSVAKVIRDLKKTAKESSLILRIVSVVKNRLNKEDIKRNRINAPKSAWTLDEEEYERYGGKGLKTAAENLDRLHALLKRHRIKLTLAVYPWPYQVYHRDLESRQVKFWRRWAQEHNVDFIDLFPYFINDRPWFEVLDEYFIPGDLHWNSRGHALVAEEFLRRWKR